MIAGGYAVESSYEYTLPEYSDNYSTHTYMNTNVNPGQAQAAFMGGGRKTQEDETVADVTTTDKASASLRGNGD